MAFSPVYYRLYTTPNQSHQKNTPMRTALALFICCLSMLLQAQDLYHIKLDSLIRGTYTLPQGAWAFPNTELATTSGSINYGATSVTDFIPTGQLFSTARRFAVSQAQYAYESGQLYRNTANIAAGDRCLFAIWLRSNTPDAQVFVFSEDAVSYDKEAYTKAKVTNEWKLILVPFETDKPYSVNGLSCGVHLATITQEIEVGGAALINFKDAVLFSQLPVALNIDSYAGMEPNAAWRDTAAASIEQIRKANLSIRVVRPNGLPAQDAAIQIRMKRHAFGFGSAVVSNKFNGGSAQNNTYEQKLTNLDGKGHGFNEVVFENDLKWDGWEESWFSSKAELVSDMAWLKARGIKVRGHNLVWPGKATLPNDVAANLSNRTLLQARIRQHLFDILQYPGIGTACTDWDVLNEITGNIDVAQAMAGAPGYPTGREIYKDIFKLADSLAPQSKLYLNDYVAIEQGEGSPVDMQIWKSRIDELVTSGAPIEGIGFQGHFSASPTGIPRVKQIYDDFYQRYGLEAKVTEYDIDKFATQTIQANYMRDILTITFAHPSMQGFLMWGHWDGAHWLGNAPIFREDWTVKPSGQAFFDLVFKKWWTDITISTNASGEAKTRGFKGDYEVIVHCGGQTDTIELQLLKDTSLVVQLNCTVATDQPENQGLFAAKVLQVSGQNITVTFSNALELKPMHGRVFSAAGGLAAEHTDNQILESNGQMQFAQTADLPTGIYFLVLEQAEKQVEVRFFKK
jgi:endo-1,4-beta-xylanase